MEVPGIAYSPIYAHKTTRLPTLLLIITTKLLHRSDSDGRP